MRSAALVTASMLASAALGLLAGGSARGAVAVIGLVTIALAAATIPTRAAVAIAIAASLAPRFGYSVSGFKILPEHVASVFLLLHVAMRGRLGNILDVALRPAPLAALCLIGWGVVAAHFFAPEPFASSAIAGWLLLSWTTMVCVAGSGLTRDQVMTLLLVAGSIAMSVSLILYILALSGISDWGTAREQLTGAEAIRGLWPEQNLLGSSASLLALLGLTWRRPHHSRTAIFLAGSAILVLALTFTRAALIGFIAAVALYFIFSSGATRRRTILATLATAGALASITVIFPAQIAPVFEKYSPSEAVNLTQGTGRYRANIVAQAFGDLENSAWIHGLGTNSFGQRHVEQYDPSQRGYLPVLPLQLLYDYGFIGVLIAFYGLFALFRSGPPATNRKLLSGFVAFLIASLATSAFWFASVWIMVAVGLMTSDSREDSQSGPNRE